MGILEVKEISMYFGKLAALSRVSLSVNEGEILGLIGPNGAGKTTFFNCLTGYLTCSRGSIYFQGKEITQLPSYRICHLGMCRTFQITQSFQEMTVLENVMIGAFCRHRSLKMCMNLAKETLEFTGLADRSDQIAGSLTLAGQKRIELARALSTKPKILLLDEVMAGLTSKEQEEAVELINKIYERGITMIVIEHVVEVIRNISHRVMVFDVGELIADGPPGKVLRDERVIRAYLGDEYNAKC